MTCSKLFVLCPVIFPTSRGECVCCLRLIVFKSALIHSFSKVSANILKFDICMLETNVKNFSEKNKSPMDLKIETKLDDNREEI